ncbi:MAG: hypothetical protein E7416_04615 [Ruminococcaceae bacterium]|nr:hypothetical protein [Oscillospiraceae bacterium]
MIKRLLLILLCVSVLFGITACNAVDDAVNKAEDIVDSVMVAFKICDFKTTTEFIDMDKYEDTYSLFSDNQMYLTKFFDDLEYDIVSSKQIDDNTVNVTAKITAIDMLPVLRRLLSETVQFMSTATYADAFVAEKKSIERMEKILNSIANDDELETVTNEVVIKVVKNGSKWRIVPEEAFINAVSGDFPKALKEIESYDAE